MTTHASHTTHADQMDATLARAVTWAFDQAGTDALADTSRLKSLIAEAPVADSPERTMLIRNLDEEFLAPFAQALAAEKDGDALDRAVQDAERHLVSSCFIDERIARSAAVQFAQGLVSVRTQAEAETATEHASTSDTPEPAELAGAPKPAVPQTSPDGPPARAGNPMTEPAQLADAPQPVPDASVAPAQAPTGTQTSEPTAAPQPAPEPASSPTTVGMKTYGPATGDHDALSPKVNSFVAALGQRKVRTIAAYVCALALGAYLLFGLVTPNKAKLTFHGNGATGGIMMSITADQGSLVELPLCGFRRDGYEFVGWYNENTHELLLAQSLVTAQGKVSYMAEWAPVVQFDTGGTSPATLAPITVTRGDTIELPKASFSKPPFEFLGWSVEGGEDSWHEPGETVAISGPTTFVAAWGYTLSFRGNGATDGSVAPVKSLEGEKVLLPENGFSYPDHKFSGWAQDLSETKPAKPGEEVTVNRSLVFHAIWRNKVQFDGNGATGGSTKAFFAKTSGKAVLPECGFERDGFTFVGWSATKPQEAGESADETPIEATAVAEAPVELHQPGEQLIVTQPTTYYACWEPLEEPTPLS